MRSTRPLSWQHLPAPVLVQTETCLNKDEFCYQPPPRQNVPNAAVSQRRNQRASGRSSSSRRGPSSSARMVPTRRPPRRPRPMPRNAKPKIGRSYLIPKTPVCFFWSFLSSINKSCSAISRRTCFFDVSCSSPPMKSSSKM